MDQINIHPKILLEDDSLSEDAQRAYCLANSMIPELNEFIDQKEELEAKAIEPKEEVTEIESQIDDKIEQRENEKESLENIYSDLQDKKDRLRFVLNEASRTPVLKWFWFLFNGKSWRKKYESLKEEVNSEKLNYLYHKNEILMLEEVIDDLKNKLEAKKEELDELSHGIDDLPEVPKVLTAIGEINLSFFPMKISGDDQEDSNAEYGIIDFNSPNLQFKLPRMDIDQDSLEEKTRQLDPSKINDILIQPDESEKDQWGENWNSLIGEERNYYNSIQKLQTLLRDFRTEQCQLPLMEQDNPLSSTFQEALNNLEKASRIRPKHDVQNDFRKIKKDKEKLSIFFSDNLKNLKILTKQVNKEKLNEKHEQLNNKRKNSSDYLINSIEDIAHHSSLASNYYFCPQCNLQIDYIKSHYGIDLTKIADINRLPTEKLEEQFKNSLNSRLDSNQNNNLSEDKEEELRNHWNNIFGHLKELENEIQNIDDKITSLNTELEELYLKRKQYNTTSLYKKIIFKLLKNPFTKFNSQNIDVNSEKEFSIERLKNLSNQYEKNTRLNYKIDDNTWKCPSCKNRFKHSEAKLGKANKFKFEIKTPVLNSLWNSDKTKSELEELEQNFKDKFNSIIDNETEKVQNNINEFISDSEDLKDNIQKKREQFSDNMEKIKSRLKDIIESQEETEVEDINEITDHLKSELEEVPEVIENIESNKEYFSEVPDYVKHKTKYIYSQKFEEAVDELEHPEQMEE